VQDETPHSTTVSRFPHPEKWVQTPAVVGEQPLRAVPAAQIRNVFAEDQPVVDGEVPTPVASTRLPDGAQVEVRPNPDMEARCAGRNQVRDRRVVGGPGVGVVADQVAERPNAVRPSEM